MKYEFNLTKLSPFYELVPERDCIASLEMMSSCWYQNESPLLLETLLGNRGSSVGGQDDLLAGATAWFFTIAERSPLAQAGANALRSLESYFDQERVALPRPNTLG